MNSIQFDTNKDTLKDIISKVSGILTFLPCGMYELTIGKPRRTTKQNKAIHAIFQEVSDAWIEIGFQISFGKFEATPTAPLVKEFFKGLYLAGKPTTEQSTKELADALTKFMRDINTQLRNANCDRTIQIENDDLRSLLESIYNSHNN